MCADIGGVKCETIQTALYDNSQKNHVYTDVMLIYLPTDTESKEKWESFKPICNKYICDQPEQLHTSIEYHTNFETFKPKFMDNFEIECDIKLVDITSDKPEEWKIIK